MGVTQGKYKTEFVSRRFLFSVCLILNRSVSVHLYGYVGLCLCVVLDLDDSVPLDLYLCKYLSLSL